MYTSIYITFWIKIERERFRQKYSIVLEINTSDFKLYLRDVNIIQEDTVISPKILRKLFPWNEIERAAHYTETSS